MASGWNLWLQCIGVVSECCIRRCLYIDILTIITNFPYSTCISSSSQSSVLAVPCILYTQSSVLAVPCILKTEKTFKNEQRSKDAAAKKRPNTSGVGKINNYYEDIYIPHNNTD